MGGVVPSVVRSVAAVAASPRPSEELLPEVLETICDHLGFTSAVLYQVDESCRHLEALAFHGFPDRLPARLKVFPLARSRAMMELCKGQASRLSHEDGSPDVASRFAAELGLPEIRWTFLPLRRGQAVTGVVGFIAPPDDGGFSRDQIDTLEVVSYQLASVVRSIQMERDFEQEQHQLREDLRTSHAMLRAAEAMAEKADLDAVLQALVSIVHQETKRYAIVTLISNSLNEITLVADAGGHAILDRTVPLASLDPVLRQSLVERRSVVIEQGPMPSAMGMPSGRFLSVPLINEGSLIGNIEVDDPPVKKDALDREIRTLQGIAFEAGAAIANARLYEQQRRSAGLREALNDINSMLNESIERPGSLEPVIRRAAHAVPADGALLALLHDDEWIAESTTGTEPNIAGEPIAAGDVLNAKNALKIGAPVLRPEVLTRGLRPGMQSGIVLVVPLQLRKRPFGAMLFRRDNWADTLDSETLDFATKLGVSVSLALGNRYLYEHEHRVSQTLQQALLSMPDSVPGLSLSHLYLAAAERTRVGGDFYDAFELPEDKVALVIGDVSGKGLDAAALTALAKNALKAHAIEGLVPAEVLGKTNDIVYQFSSMETFVTVFFAVVDPKSGEMVYANGGHLPPFVVSPKGIRQLTGEGPLLGAFATSEYASHADKLESNEVLVLYTDGLTEARSANGTLYGEERLGEALMRLRRTKVQELPKRLMVEASKFTHSGLSDDVAIMAASLKRPRGL